MIKKKEFITEKEVSEITSRALQSLRNDRVRKKGIPYYKYGSRVLNKYSEVMEHVELMRVETAP
ncbi:DNA-binding protein [Candidatus Latescibacterota bacterium]